MYELKVVNSSGEELNLSATKDYIVYKIEGLTPTKATINSSVNSVTDGTTINSSHVESRNVVLYMTIEGDIEKNRINLYKYFMPKRTVTLYLKNGTRDVYIEGMVELIECDLFANKQIAQISIICPNPYFRSVEKFIATFSDIQSLLEFPFALSKSGIALSEISSNVRKSIIYTGDVASGVVIELFAVGEVVNPIIYDVQKKTHIALNFSMQESDRILINTNYNQKSITLIRSGVSYNALGYLRQDSSWLVLEAGDNVFTYDADSGNSNLQIVFSTSLLYGGV